MLKSVYWKDILQSFHRSKGRFFSICSLMAIGAMALIGLKVTAPNMERTAQNFIDRYQTMDMMVMGSMGLGQADVDELENLEDVQLEFGHLEDVLLGEENSAVRLYSKPQTLSQFKLLSGQFPQSTNQIALSDQLEEQYAIGDWIAFDLSEESTVSQERFEVTGFVASSEVWGKTNLGLSQLGRGRVEAYGLVLPEVFETEIYSLARLRFKDMEKLAYHSLSYQKQANLHQEDLEELLEDNGAQRLVEIKAEPHEKLSQAKEDLAQKEKELEESLSSLGPLREQVLADPKFPYQQAREKLSQAKEELAVQERELDKIPEPIYTVASRRSLSGSEGYETYRNATDSIAAVGNIFPVVLYLVAALVTFTTMTRFVDEERGNAGIFKALGYGSRSIIRKFVLYGLVASMTGTFIGILLGNFLISPMIGRIISATTVIGESQLFLYPEWLILAVVLGFLSAVLPAYLVARRELSQRPAQLLQTKPPVSGASILLEKWTWLWRRLSFTHKVTVRNIFRYKQRMAMTIFGVAGSVSLLFAGLGIRSSISGVAETQFGQLIAYDLVLMQNPALTEKEEKEIEDFLQSDQIKASLPVYTETLSVKIAGVDQKQVVSLFVPSDTGAFSDFVTLKSSQPNQELALDKTGVVISKKLAQLYEVEVGEQLALPLADGTVTAQVTGVVDMYAGHFIYLSADYYEDLTKTGLEVNASLVKLASRDLADQEIVAAQALELTGVLALLQNRGLMETLENLVASLHSVMLILVVLSILLGVVILYNLTTINVAERIRELSTIKVLGFHNKEVTLYIYRETIVLSLIGMILGLAGGFVLHRVLLEVIGSASMVFHPTVSWEVYLIPVASVSVILSLLGWWVNRTLRQVDMLEALKSVE